MSTDALPKGREQKKLELAQFYHSFDKSGDCSELWKQLLEYCGLDKFADSSDPTKIPSKDVYDGLFYGNPDWVWYLRTSGSMRFSHRSNEWRCDFMDVNGAVKFKRIDLLKTALEPIEYYRVNALINLLDFIQKYEERLDEERLDE